MKALKLVAQIVDAVGCVGLPVPALSEGYDAAELNVALIQMALPMTVRMIKSGA